MKKIRFISPVMVLFAGLLLVLVLPACGEAEEEEIEPAAEPTPELELDFEQPLQVEAVTDRQYINKARQLIREAEHTLHLSQLYMNFDHVIRDLLGELEDAAERGVQIKVLLNQAEDPADRNRRAMEILARYGAEVKEEGRPGAGKLHAKIIVADRSRALVGSTNWSAMSIRNNHETNLLIKQPKVADFYVRWIEELYREPTENPELEPVKINGSRTVIDREHEDVIAELIDEAGEKIWLGIYAFRTYFGTQYEGSTSDRMVEKLADAVDRGLDVRVIIEYSDYNEMINNFNAQTARELLDRGVEVRAAPEHLNTHWKLLVVDGQVLAGSMNWGYSGFDLHAEASFLTDQKNAVGEMERYFLARWNNAEEYPVEKILD